MGREVLMIGDDRDMDRLAALVAEKVAGILKPQSQSVEQHLTHKEAADFLKIGRNTLTDRIKNGTYPMSIVHINGSRKVYYKSELKELLSRKK